MGEIRINLTNFITVGIMAVLFSMLATKLIPLVKNAAGGNANA